MPELSFDDTLVKYLGEFGAHQKKICLLASLFWLPNALFILLMVFTGKDPIKERWFECTDPTDTACARVLALSAPASTDFCGLAPGSWHWTKPSYSVISQFNLVCGKAWLSQLVNSAFFLGYLLGSGIFGTMADHHGRKITLLASTCVATVFTIMAGCAPNYWVYFAARLLTGVGAAGQALVTYLIATESIGPTWRGVAGVGTQMFFVLGEFLLVLVALIFKPWRGICFATVAISAASFAIFVIIPESPRWLLAKGRVAAANLVMERIAHENGTRMPLEPVAHGASGDGDHSGPAAVAAGSSDHLPSSSDAGIHHRHSDVVHGTGRSEAGGGHSIASVGSAAGSQAAGAAGHMTLGSMLKDRHIARRFFILAYVWMVLCMCYYGISLGLSALKGSIYVTFFITSAAELPANAMGAWMIERIGRHNSLAAGILVGGTACLVCSFLPAGGLQAVFAAIGKFGCAGAFTIASIFTSELFPTLVRSAVLGAENEAARVGGIAAPWIVLLGTQLNMPAMPFLIFGCTSVLAGLLIFTLPETLGAPMPDTMKDMDNIASIFTTGAWRKGWRHAGSEMFAKRAYGASAGNLQKISEKIAEEGRSTPPSGTSPPGGAT
eukprot:CAMPEP_0202879236 /NCGR_PEP_ID=MMETSP1391-20130828/33331_1 /ASSEMBLY_ACC=CAM_ASM_000867 /TAXON_ID=1034604 /ORGANISM="Chlamydomonas leiostraca, Strain SAG 11-49" /LENGTH=609 /DNA_ID=CAMNT_0049561553 /DNA_START=103 /DNA_END=1928 /DNA_ORIENTATION=+